MQAIIEQAVLTPNIMSQQVGLHPVVILLALFVCGALFGLLGLVLAVPAAALVAGVVGARREALVIDLGEDAATRRGLASNSGGGYDVLPLCGRARWRRTVGAAAAVLVGQRRARSAGVWTTSIGRGVRGLQVGVARHGVAESHWPRRTQSTTKMRTVEKQPPPSFLAP